MEILQGIDLLKVERIKKIYLIYKDKFLKKIIFNFWMACFFFFEY